MTDVEARRRIRSGLIVIGLLAPALCALPALLLIVPGASGLVVAGVWLLIAVLVGRVAYRTLRVMAAVSEDDRSRDPK